MTRTASIPPLVLLAVFVLPRSLSGDACPAVADLAHDQLLTAYSYGVEGLGTDLDASLLVTSAVRESPGLWDETWGWDPATGTWVHSSLPGSAGEFLRFHRVAAGRGLYAGAVYSSSAWRLLIFEGSESPVERVLPGEPTSLAVFPDLVVAGSGSAVSSDGRVWIYEKGPTGWDLSPTVLSLPLPGAGLRFGWDVALDSAASDSVVLIVGAPGREAAPATAGLVYEFRRDTGRDWAYFDSVEATLVDDAALFGQAVDVQGDWLLVGSPGLDVFTYTDLGAVYSFARGAGGLWESEEVNLPVDLVSGVRFGSSLDVEEDGLVVGAPGPEDGSIPAAPASLFFRDETGWDPCYRLLLDVSPRNQAAGRSVAMTQHGPLVGTPGFGSDQGWIQFYRDPRLFADGFESGDTERWSSQVP